MITCGESLCNLGKNEAKIWVVSDSVLSADQKWDFEIIRFAKIQQITFKATLTVLHTFCIIVSYRGVHALKA